MTSSLFLLLSISSSNLLSNKSSVSIFIDASLEELYFLLKKNLYDTQEPSHKIHSVVANCAICARRGSNGNSNPLT